MMNENVKSILSNSIVIDAHLDLLYDVELRRRMGQSKVIEAQYLNEFNEGGVNLIVSSIYIDDMFLPEMALRKALNQISALYSEIDESPDKIMFCKSFGDIERAVREKKIGIMLSFEGVEPLYNDLSLLRIFYELGVRLVGLTWSRRNFAADGSRFKKVREGTRGGLTDFGISLVEKAEDLGMIVDVSHLNDEGFWDVMKIVKNPIIASHSNTRTLTNIPRNLTDEQIKAIASKNGVVGINAASLIVADDDKKANIEGLIDHIDHIVKVVGAKHVGLGFDFCDRLFQNSSPESVGKLPRKSFDVMKHHGQLNEFTDILLRRGYKENEIKLILGENFLRVFKEVF